MNSLLRWVGGKHRLAGRIVEMLPEHRCYVETCVGGGWVLFRKAPSRCEVINDVDGELVNLYRVLQRRGKALICEVDSYPYSRAVYNAMYASRPAGQFARAVRFLYVNRVAFGGKMDSRSFGVQRGRPSHVLPAKVRQERERIIDRLRGVLIEQMDVEAILSAYDGPETACFVDPPYLGLSQPYAGRFDLADHARLASALERMRGRFLLSCNDCPEIRELYRGMEIHEASVSYTVGQTARAAAEILVTNYPVPAESERRSRQPNANRDPS